MERDDSPPPVQRSGRGGGFGRYRFIAEIGRGGSAVVHLAVDQEPGESGRLVAIKELRTELRDDDDAVATFLERARTAARLNHPSLVQTLEVGRFGFRCFHAMEYVDGPTLNEVVQRARRQGLPMPLPMLLRVLTEVLAALEYAHSLVDFDGTPLGLVHRDVGLHNVVVTYGGAVKILDFGTLKVHGGKTSAGEGHGGREDAYPAPECLYGLPVDRRADVFAVGVMLWQGIVTTGAAQSKSHQLAGPDSARADIDPGLFAIVERAMTADPAGRYPTALAMRTELESHAKRARLALPDTRALAAFVARARDHARGSEHDARRAVRSRLSRADRSRDAGPRSGRPGDTRGHVAVRPDGRALGAGVRQGRGRGSIRARGFLRRLGGRCHGPPVVRPLVAAGRRGRSGRLRAGHHAADRRSSDASSRTRRSDRFERGAPGQSPRAQISALARRGPCGASRVSAFPRGPRRERQDACGTGDTSVVDSALRDRRARGETGARHRQAGPLSAMSRPGCLIVYCVSQKLTGYDTLHTGADAGQSDTFRHRVQDDAPVAT
jgi:hypothetical protein